MLVFATVVEQSFGLILDDLNDTGSRVTDMQLDLLRDYMFG